MSINHLEKEKLHKRESIDSILSKDDKDYNSEGSVTTMHKKQSLNSEMKHSFKVRSSWLDHTISSAKINESEFRGIFRLILVLLIMFVVRHLYELFFSPNPAKKELLVRVFKDIEFIFILWPLFHIWTYLAFLLQKLILLGLPPWLASTFQHLTQSGIFILTSYFCLVWDMCTSHNIFICIQCMIHFFKMHSYTEINKQYRVNYLACKKSGEKPYSSYPENVNFKNFFYFLCAPTFIYQEEYPKSNEPIMWTYILKKFLMSAFSLLVLYYVYTEYVEIYFPQLLDRGIVEMITLIALPVLIISVIGFYLVFEQVLPAYAEFTKFEDRLFYDDWWNSTTMEEFNRKWNRIVHQFLYRHVYLPGIKEYGLSTDASKIVTFLFSALLHEYCIVMVFRFFRPILFVLMMFQIPLMAFTSGFWKKHKSFGNSFFWFSIITGNALLFVMYNREYLKIYGHNF